MLRLVAEHQRTTDIGLPGGDGWAGHRIRPGDSPNRPVTGDGRWPGSGLPTGDGRWPVGADLRWPELESAPPPRGGRTGPDPWPVLPDDRALWTISEPVGGDGHRMRRLDGEQAGG
ncbi:hypothetical protein [Verrucosispora sioxanthis]|uniref:hypothetical protein n=1 Tax=Verrucosispora sioxanthis TaxID=2499994 RepID=UPI001C127740|nr:hypothetical protein [Verrucosispora sioxanthis]